MSATQPTTSVVHPSAVLGHDVQLGEGCVIEADVRIGPGSRVGHHVVIHAGTEVGERVRIDDHATLGKHPMRAANSATTKEQELPALKVGDESIVGTGVVLYRGAAIAGRVLMADLCTIRENVTIGRGTIVGRGVTVENVCTIGRYVFLPQFARPDGRPAAGVIQAGPWISFGILILKGTTAEESGD